MLGLDDGSKKCRLKCVEKPLDTSVGTVILYSIPTMGKKSFCVMIIRFC